MFLALTILMCITAIKAILHKNIISTIIIMGAFSILSALAYTSIKAPDVAITEVAVNASVSTMFTLFSVMALRRKSSSFEPIKSSNQKQTQNNSQRILYILSTICFFLTLNKIMSLLPNFGEVNNIPNTAVGDLYSANAEHDFGVPNIVTAVLGGYRGFDTLIETTVAFTGAFGSYNILLCFNEKQNNHSKKL
ncbi:DUF4040 domain-containing protein [Rickettsiales bacterium]|nr:DUF4040 domain-containing protein [Rickettsiales bacterium]